MNTKFEYYLLISCALHGVLIAVLYLISGSSVIPTNFLVFGAHSKEHLETLYKPMRSPIPFVPSQTQSVLKPKSEAEPEKFVVKEKTSQEKKSTMLEQENKKPLVPQQNISKEAVKPKKISVKKTEEKIQSVKRIAQHPSHIQRMLPQLQEEMIHVTQQIQEEISRLWRPPVGVPKGTECTVRFSVNKKGAVDHFEFLKRSDIIIYDLSITRIAHKFSFDRSLWGKTFTIDFRQ